VLFVLVKQVNWHLALRRRSALLLQLQLAWRSTQRMRRSCMRCVSICTFVLHYCITAAAGLEVDAADAQELHAVRQYLYFCTALLVQKYKY
jgi:hypothetical protein